MNQIPGVLKILYDVKQSIVNNHTVDNILFSSPKIKSILERFYPNSSYYNSELALIIHSISLSKAGMANIQDSFSRYHNLLDTLITEITNLGLPSKNDIKLGQSFEVNVNQNQNVEQSLNNQISIVLETLKDDLKGKQFKELQDIAKAEPDIEKAKPKIIEKLKSFGESVCSNIIANIITNPTIWQSMLK